VPLLKSPRLLSATTAPKNLLSHSIVSLGLPSARKSFSMKFRSLSSQLLTGTMSACLVTGRQVAARYVAFECIVDFISHRLFPSSSRHIQCKDPELGPCGGSFHALCSKSERTRES
jgi:hypothetical protein